LAHAFLREYGYEKAEVGPTSGPTRRRAHLLVRGERVDLQLKAGLELQPAVVPGYRRFKKSFLERSGESDRSESGGGGVEGTPPCFFFLRFSFPFFLSSFLICRCPYEYAENGLKLGFL
jgi:hypothetical protein